MNSELIRKYNVPGPRYTSYPTVPYWDERSFSIERWNETCRRSFSESGATDGIGVYIHLPFCESLCTFCGCTKRITRNHAVEEPYIDALLCEWSRYVELWGETPRIKELHLGGGTPTFFAPENLRRLITALLADTRRADNFEFGVEAHPNNTTRAHLQTLHDLGFRRLSLGIQDFDPEVQRIINRVQPFERVAQVTQQAREIGYASINFDLVYGLPRQGIGSIVDTVQRVNKLLPDRIAYYSYAHVPWIRGIGQRKFSVADLPSGEEKLALYMQGRRLLEEVGYCEIGMDHFALQSDTLYQSAQEGSLHRNFMGYTPIHTQLSVGLGMSAISDSWYGFAQNAKKIEAYSERVKQGVSPSFRGHILTDEDLLLRRHILNLMCRFETTWKDEHAQHPAVYAGLERLAEMEADGLVLMKGNRLRVTQDGRPFLRNVCMALDTRLWSNAPEAQLFSQVI